MRPVLPCPTGRATFTQLDSQRGPRTVGSTRMTTNLDARLASYSSPALSLFRIVFGLLFACTARRSCSTGPLAHPCRRVGTWPAWWAGLIEFVCGLLITLGLFTRIAAFIASGEMAVAYFWQHWPPLEGPAASFWP